ncbi:polyprotein [Plakobranchus ocellatus]|uniref:Polyprotein n=1 Tax=Plakobranchus ocellatus TaxID=259542 RepID=A0AAV3YNA3_9GAST|nr:polyprotein [Plakobranchus ocellatus]
MKEVFGQTQTDRRGLGSTTAKWWSKTEGKKKRDMIIDEIRNKEDSTRVQKAVQQPQQGQWTNWDTAIQRSLTWNDIWHMAPLRISFLIRSVYDLLSSNANLVRWRKKDDPTCPLCQGRQTTEHVLSSCKVALSQGRYTWRQNRVLQELASVISTAKGEIHPSSTSSTNGRGPCLQERKILDLTKELKKDGYEAKVMPVEIGARGFVGSSAYGLLSKLSIGGIREQKP